MSVNLEISCAPEYFRGSWGYGAVDLIRYFSARNTADTPFSCCTDGNGMADLTPNSPKFICLSVN